MAIELKTTKYKANYLARAYRLRGALHHYGNGTKKDPIQAISDYKKSIDLETTNPIALNGIAILYYEGCMEGGTNEANQKKAWEYCFKASNMNFSRAQKLLSNFYLNMEWELRKILLKLKNGKKNMKKI